MYTNDNATCDYPSEPRRGGGEQQLFHRIDAVADSLAAEFREGASSELVRPLPARQASERYLHPDRLITVVVGNPAAFERPLSTLGTVTTMRLEEIRR